jgi:hypothetical protein
LPEVGLIGGSGAAPDREPDRPFDAGSVFLEMPATIPTINQGDQIGRISFTTFLKNLVVAVVQQQGDQIGRFFAYWAVA